MNDGSATMPRRSPVGPRASGTRTESRHPTIASEPAGEARNSTVDRALRVLEAFLGEESQIGVLELSRQLDLDKSVIHRILSTLVARRFIEQDPVSRRYRVGLRIWELGQRYLAGQLLKDVAEKELTRMIAAHPYATAYLAQLDGGDVVVISTIRGPGPINLYMDPGSRLIAEHTTTGRTLLSFLPPVKADQIVARRRQAGGSIRQFPDIDEVRADFAAIRERGFGESQGRYSPGVNTVAVALCDPDGSPILALSVDYLGFPETEGLGRILPRELQDCVRRIERLVRASGTEPEA
ncbi:IclR family transcriptional regulator [Phytohabitans houttuyneae]|uniref:IclR family transcriptional regulator n=1 Tax=Phytohabitans houttuyneae TaxID=1076126 RepID=UPI001564F1F3|nr:IclR family transcriptional regulator [Phytohabitans houttuyneae]